MWGSGRGIENVHGNNVGYYNSGRYPLFEFPAVEEANPALYPFMSRDPQGTILYRFPEVWTQLTRAAAGAAVP